MREPDASELRTPLRFERRGAGTNVGGVVSADWEELDGLERIRCKATPTLGGEEVIAGRMAAKVQYDIWIRSGRDSRGIMQHDRAVNCETGEIYNLGQPIDPFQDTAKARRWLLIQAVSNGKVDQ